MVTIIPIPALSDNYIWTFINYSNLSAVVIDPGAATPIIDILIKQKLKLIAILITHHHIDHTAGIKELLNFNKKQIPVYGPKNEKIDEITHKLTQDDEIIFNELNLKLKILDTPGHTLGHIAYYGDNKLFCGDTLFTGGCGRIFEGTSWQMFESINKLKSLPPATMVYCAHEYTSNNLKFAKLIEPYNQDLQQRIQHVEQLRSKFLPTVPASIELELKTNPFLRTNQPSVQDAIKKHYKQTVTNEVEIFAKLRNWKDIF